MWFHIAGRLAYVVTPELEPFLEMGSAIQLAGENDLGELSTPFLLTPGVRFHFFGLDPAIFVSFNFEEASAIIFGIDLAGALRPRRGEAGGDDFFGDF
jgi:hypothetical protein